MFTPILTVCGSVIVEVICPSINVVALFQILNLVPCCQPKLFIGVDIGNVTAPNPNVKLELV